MSQEHQMHSSAGTADSFTTDSFSGFSDAQLRSTMDNFLEKEEDDHPNIWNTATVAGIAMFLVCMVYILHLIGLNIIPGFGAAFIPLAVVGALLVVFIGFGFFVGDRRRLKRFKKKQKEKTEDYFNRAFPPDDSDEQIDLEAELFNHSSAGSSKSTTSRRQKGFEKQAFDEYAMKHSKKLYKSRTDKKIAGVCGGLADYFGVDATWVRILFLIMFFGTSGVALPVYIILMIVLDKEPKDFLREDYDY
jgi:phage shock protein C